LTRVQEGTLPAAATAPQATWDDDRGSAHWLAVLRDGSPDEQAQARTEIRLLLERRGQLDEAAEAYYANVKAGAVETAPI
jgi:hypothetical protein